MICRFAVFIIAFLTVFLNSNTLYAAETIRFCYEDVNVYPWITGNDMGLAISEMYIVEKLTHLKFSLIRLPWKRCLLETQLGEMDGAIAASFNNERDQWGVYPKTSTHQLNREFRLHTDSFYLYARNDSSIQWKNKKLLNIGTNPIGVQLGYSVGFDLQKAGYPIKSSYTSSLELLKELDFNTIKIAVLQDYETIKTLEEHPILKKSIKRLQPPFKVADQYLLFSKKFNSTNSKLAQTIWKSIEKARNSDEYHREERALLVH